MYHAMTDHIKQEERRKKISQKSNYTETEPHWPPSVPFKANHGQLMETI